VVLNDLPADGQSQSTASRVAAAGTVHPVEAVEEPKEGIAGDTGTGVFDMEDQRVIVNLIGYLQDAGRAHVLAGIFKNIYENLPQTVGIAPYRNVRSATGHEFKFDLSADKAGLKARADHFQNAVRADPLLAQRKTVRVGHGQEVQIVHQFADPEYLLMQRRQVVGGLAHTLLDDFDFAA
jgi:hypothetical protein